jgi:predicted component of type VI protein secretion system
MSFKLSIRQGPRPNLVFDLDQDSYTIGREAGNEIVIEDPQVSRRHAQLTRQGEAYILEDIGSTNGTYVNGKRVTAPVLLSNGDTIGLADTVVLSVQAPVMTDEDATMVSDAALYAPPTQPGFAPPEVQQPVQPRTQSPAARPQNYVPPQYVPPPQYTPIQSEEVGLDARADNRRTLLIGVGCLALILVVCMIAFVAWSFIDCRSFSSVFPFLFPPFQC